jgi:hypothetical protein
MKTLTIFIISLFVITAGGVFGSLCYVGYNKAEPLPPTNDCQEKVERQAKIIRGCIVELESLKK